MLQVTKGFCNAENLPKPCLEISRNCYASLFLLRSSGLSENVSNRSQRKHSVLHAYFSGCILVEYVNPNCHSRSCKISKKTNQIFSSIFVLEGGKPVQKTKGKEWIISEPSCFFHVTLKLQNLSFAWTLSDISKISKVFWLIFNQGSEVNKLFLDQNSMLFCLLPY